MTLALPELVKGWAWTTVAEAGSQSEQPVLTGPFGTSMGSGDFVSNAPGAVPVLTIGCLRDSGIDLRKAAFVSGAKADELERYQLRRGDILFSRMATVGRAGFVEPRHEGALFNYHIMRLRLRQEAIDPRFFIYFVRGSEVVRSYVRDVNHGMTRDGINTEQLLAMPVPLAPRRSQERIVDAIDSYLSRLDAVGATLEAAQAKLKAYRSSVLKAAVEGRLVPTEAALARAEKRDFEPADVLLKRILSERRRRWEQAELAKLKAAGKSPKDDKWKAKYEEPKPPDTKDLPKLAGGWCWASLDQLLVEHLANGKSVPDGDGFPVLRLTAIKGGTVDLRERKNGDWGDIDPRGFAVKADDFLIVRGNGSTHLVGRGGRVVGVVDEVAYPDTLIRAHVARSGVLASLLPHWWDSPPIRKHIERRAKTTAGIHKVNQTDLACTPIPVAPVAEQRRLVDEIERLVSVGAACAEQVNQSLLRASRLRQAVLKWAFEGKLVDQDPNDEPAAELLERIRVERADTETPQRTRRARNAK